MQRRNLLKSLNGDGRYGWALLGVLALLWLLAAGGPSWTQALCYERRSIARGELWRLLTGHWVHLGPGHLRLDSLGLILLWALYARELPPRAWMLVLLGATAGIDGGLWWGEPQIQWYVGISGLLHAAWAAGAAALLTRRDRRGWRLHGALMLALLAVKLRYEHGASVSLLDQSMPVVTAAHEFGAVAGLLGGLLGGVLAARALAPPPESL